MEHKFFLHEHPLYFCKELSRKVHNKTRDVKCSSGCGRPISVQFYVCIDCKFFLHKSCAELPLNITFLFHDNHPLTLLANAPPWAFCDFCDDLVNGFVYHCSSCKYNLDIKCALLPQFLNGNLPKVDHQIHVEHPLFFIENHSHEVKLPSFCYCSICLEQLLDASFYTCVVCKLFFHKSCFETELPLNISHPFHEKHTLTLTLLKRDKGVRCQLCRNYRYPVGLSYHCSSCHFHLDIECAFLPQFRTGNFPKRDHHFSDVQEHPLFFIQKDLISSNKVELPHSHCFVCSKSLSRSSFYYCPECQFFVHKSCDFEKLPSKINHPFHDKHAITLQERGPEWWRSSVCKFCLNFIKGCRYRCSSCEFQLDPRCALLITKDLPKRDHHHFSHVEHPLVFVQMLSNEVEINSSCSVCPKPLLGTSFYNCIDCGFFLHKECEAELWPKIEHVAHPQHPLTFVFSAKDPCNFCRYFIYRDQSDVKKCGYECPHCDFYIHHGCTLLKFFQKSKIHDHQLTPFMRKNSFNCDACGAEGDGARYVCSTCSIMIHKDCIFLPKFIKIKLHNHHILCHKYSLPQKEGEKWTCQFCFKKVVAEYGSYKCLHSDCTYVLHGSCVKKNEGRLYIEVESENEESDNEASSSSSCAVALGDKIDHFSHGHELVLDNEEIIINGDKKCCNGCALPILTAAYSCPQAKCNFSLHKACAQIGEDKPHWASRDPVLVIMESHFECRFCKYDCSGFCSIWKGVDGNRREICHRCSEIDFITKHEAHAQHFLFCDEDHKGPCSGCGKGMGDHGGYRCTLAEEEENCKFFALDYRCMTWPLTAEHRFHHHPLKLTYEDPYKDDGGDPFQHMCEICEDRRDPKLWFYRCDECDFDAHPDCVLGEYPFIKRGSIYFDWFSRCDSHQRPLIYFQSEKYPYPKCYECGNPCKDQLALKCPHSECNFALHFECRYLLRLSDDRYILDGLN
ncbi:hypothetical protein SLEP1_g41941 [Rubroshorea leprosula]|uniref:Phorbol-ester/DAG-type domain-containing protein n=1 Tax=Rubroshorea leprosula TaxID=152421 RepID=A0AAV5L8A3_9ROSI|nr:hypothetical protein SLEP1_g41941 [Rubroshorea leprosula]